MTNLKFTKLMSIYTENKLKGKITPFIEVIKISGKMSIRQAKEYQDMFNSSELKAFCYYCESFCSADDLQLTTDDELMCRECQFNLTDQDSNVREFE